jgi:hypothetical protein
MPEPRITWTTARKLAVFRACFSGLKHVYGTYDLRTGKARQVKKPVTERVILNHLRGIEPYGVYLLCGDRTRAVVVDFDDEDTHPPLRFIRQAGRYGLHANLEKSKRRGWHVYLFMKLPGVSAAKARLVVKSILDDIGQSATEVFPKQDRLAGTTRYGNFIFLPLWGVLVPEGRTVFVAPEDGLVPYVDQWEFLANIQRATESQLDDIIANNGLDNKDRTRPQPTPPSTAGALRYSYGLPPCAQRMLAEGVTQHQRVACFRLALHVKRAGIPQDIGTAALMAWATKNRPKDGNRVITEAEIIEQAACAYDKPYRSCGCEEPAVMPFCEPACPLQRKSRATATLHDQQACSAIAVGCAAPEGK